MRAHNVPSTRFLLRAPAVVGLLALLVALVVPALAQEGASTTVYTTRSVFMRAGPAVTWRVVATLPGGEQLTVVDQYTNWYQVQRTDGTVGWVSGSYLTGAPPGSGGGGGVAGAPLVPKPPEINTLAIVSTPLLNVRSGPGLNFPAGGTVKGGEIVTVLAREAQWRLIRSASGVEGWVNSYYLSSSISPVLNLGGGGAPPGVIPGMPLGGPLAFRQVVFDHAGRDSSRPGGAVVTMRIEFTGGTAPFAISSDGFPKGSGLTPANRMEGNTTIGTLFFTELSHCGATMVHTVSLVSADGQSVSQGYYVSPVICPN